MSTMKILLIEELENERELLQLQLADSEKKVVYLEEQLNWFKRQLSGKRSEREVSHVDASQLEFAGFESLQEADQEEKDIPAHTRRKPENKGKASIVLPKNLPVETVVTAATLPSRSSSSPLSIWQWCSSFGVRTKRTSI